MASVSYRTDRGTWRVQWFAPDGKRLVQNFASEGEARAFVPPDERAPRKPGGGPGRGHRRRTAAQVKDLILSRSSSERSGCRVWTGSLTNAGYARLTWVSDEGYPIRGAHRLAYHLWVAPVPNDRLLSIDHLCRNRACVNPDHLELVTQRENVMRSPIAPGAINAAKTHCAQGHPYDAENTYVWRHTTRSTTARICRACQAEYGRRRQAARRVEVSA